MSDHLATALSRLAPIVDGPASRELFDRERSPGGGTRRWLAAAAAVVLVAGVVGVWAIARDDDATVPLDPPSTTAPSSFDGPATEGSGYDTLLVAETNAGFGNALLATDVEQYEAAWTDFLVDGEPPTVDFTRSVALVMTRPDNACADTIVEFAVQPGDPPVWTPVFEDLSEACNDPLLSWLYIVALDRSALGDAATIRIPAAEVYDVNETLLAYAYAGGGGSDDETAEPTPVVLESTGVTVPLPDVGAPEFHSTSIGFVWAVAHEDGTFSVLPGTVDAPVSEDLGAMGPIASLVRVSSSGRTFSSGIRLTWDDRGRAISGGRSGDLSRLAGRAVDTDVGPAIEILTSTAPRVEGAPTPRPEGEEYPLPPVGEPIDLATWVTLSSSGPIWRHLDATLVVEDGVGQICDILPDPVPDLATCADAEAAGGLALDTQVRSDDTDITTWFHAPILAFQDPVRGFTTVVPLGGQSGRNDAAGSEPQAGAEDVAQGDGWRLLASGRVREFELLPRWAVDQPQYDELTSRLGIGEGAQPDFMTEVVVSFPVWHNGCIPELIRVFLAESGLWRAAFGPGAQESEEGCNDIGLTSAWVVALDRSGVGDVVRLDVPGDPLTGRNAGSLAFDSLDGSLIEGGLSITDRISGLCGEETAAIVTVASVIERDVEVTLRSGGGVIAGGDAQLVGREPVSFEILVPREAIGDERIQATARSLSPAAEAFASIDADQLLSDFDQC